jgi:hypothetical protein
MQLDAFEEHQRSALKQREAYNTLIKQKTFGTCVVTLDFKQNVVLPMLKDTPSRFFYKNKQVYVFALVVNFFSGTVLHENVFVYISEALNHDFFYIRTCLKNLFQMPFMHQFTKIYIFSDNAQVFRSAAYFHFILKELSNVGRKRNVILNFFCQHHGKSSCDRYFGLISKYLLASSLSADIRTFTELFDVLKQWRPSPELASTHAYCVRMYAFSLFVPSSMCFFFCLKLFRYKRKSKNVLVHELNIPLNSTVLSLTIKQGKVHGSPLFSSRVKDYIEMNSMLVTKPTVVSVKVAPNVVQTSPDHMAIGPHVVSYLLRRKLWMEKQSSDKEIDFASIDREMRGLTREPQGTRLDSAETERADVVQGPEETAVEDFDSSDIAETSGSEETKSQNEDEEAEEVDADVSTESPDEIHGRLRHLDHEEEEEEEGSDDTSSEEEATWETRPQTRRKDTGRRGAPIGLPRYATRSQRSTEESSDSSDVIVISANGRKRVRDPVTGRIKWKVQQVVQEDE